MYCEVTPMLKVYIWSKTIDIKSIYDYLMVCQPVQLQISWSDVYRSPQIQNHRWN